MAPSQRDQARTVIPGKSILNSMCPVSPWSPFRLLVARPPAPAGRTVCDTVRTSLPAELQRRRIKIEPCKKTRENAVCSFAAMMATVIPSTAAYSSRRTPREPTSSSRLSAQEVVVDFEKLSIEMTPVCCHSRSRHIRALSFVVIRRARPCYFHSVLAHDGV